MNVLPLSGIRILDLSRVLAGPYCCTLLAELGAEVIKIERPGTGDENRRWGHLWHGVSLDYLNVNRNKRDLTVDLRKPEGQAIIRKLVTGADVLVENFVPGTLNRLGLGHADLEPLNPRLIYCSISGYGEKGPFRDKPAYDGAVQAFSGHMHITGEPTGGPSRTGASVIDMTTGIVAWGAVMGALLGRAQTGKGQKVSVSLLRTALALMGTHGATFLNTGIEPKRSGSGVSHLAPYGAYPAKDTYIVTGALNDTTWRKLCVALGAEQLADDDRFRDPQLRLANRQALDATLADIFRTRTAQEWTTVLEVAGIVVATVNTLGQALQHPQVADNDMLVEYETTNGPLVLVGAPAVFSGPTDTPREPPPALGAHSDEILRDLGYSDSDIDRLRRNGVV